MLVHCPDWNVQVSPSPPPWLVSPPNRRRYPSAASYAIAKSARGDGAIPAASTWTQEAAVDGAGAAGGDIGWPEL